MANFLLIHGAWHGGWCWDRVVTLLEQQGHRVSAPTLAGLEQGRSDEVDGISLETHANDIVEAARSLRSPDLVVVGHSYAGFPLTAAADRLRGEVSHYLYLEAGVPERAQGTSKEPIEDSPRSRRRRGARHRPEDTLGVASRFSARQTVFPIVSFPTRVRGRRRTSS